MNRPNAVRGVLWVHSASAALIPHVLWAMARAGLAPADGARPGPRLFARRPGEPARCCAEIAVTGPAGAADALADDLARWPDLVFEIAVDPAGALPGRRIQAHPELGTWAGDVDAAGNIVLGENLLRAILARAGGDGAAIAEAVDRALGGPWDRLLEPLRPGTAGHAPIPEPAAPEPPAQGACPVLPLVDPALRRARRAGA